MQQSVFQEVLVSNLTNVQQTKLDQIVNKVRYKEILMP